jgi:hypothetical protein
MIKDLGDLFGPLTRHGVGGKLCMHYPVLGYRFGNGQLPQSYLMDTGYYCPACGQRVLKTKSPIAVGAGKRLMAWSCHCYGVLAEREQARTITSDYWENAIMADMDFEYDQ